MLSKWLFDATKIQILPFGFISLILVLRYNVKMGLVISLTNHTKQIHNLLKILEGDIFSR